jgi:hypothetical protein
MYCPQFRRLGMSRSFLTDVAFSVVFSHIRRSSFGLLFYEDMSSLHESKFS